MSKKHYTKVCKQPWEVMIVSTRGDVSACCGGYHIGNINLEEDVWNSEKAIELRKNLIEGKAKNQCAICPYYKVHINSELSDEPERPKEYNESIILENPKRIELYITEKCNLKCFMCSTASRHGGVSIDLSEDMLKYIAKKYFDNLETLNTNCGGEIFIYKHFDLLLDLLEKHRPNYVNTNSAGSLNISMETWERIVKTHDLISFSVDAATPLTHRIIRGFEFEKLLENIEKLKELKKRKINPKFSYGFNFVCMKLNVKEMTDFVKKAWFEWGASVITFMHVTGEENKGQSLLVDKEDRIIFNKEIDKIIELKKEHNMHIVNLNYCLDKNGEIER